MQGKRVTIYDIAEALGMSGSYVSRALNNHPAVSEKIRELVKNKAAELHYKHDTRAANLRRGSSKTIGVIVPKINQSFFSEAIAGIEEVCFANHHSLIICQSHESFQQECKAIDTLIHQNVDCIMISISAETQSPAHLENILEHGIELVQFDRCIESLDSYKVVNDNEETSYDVVMSFIREGYKKIAFLGGPEQLPIYKSRKEGYLKAVAAAGLVIPYNFIVDNILPREKAAGAAAALLAGKNRPDAFFTVSDLQSLGVLQAADAAGISVPGQLGIFGFANEAFTEFIKPALSSVDQNSKELGKRAAELYFSKMLQGGRPGKAGKKEVIKSRIIVRASSMKSGVR